MCYTVIVFMLSFLCNCSHTMNSYFSTFLCTDSGTEPFKEVAQWWSKVAQASGLPLYVIYPEDKVCTDAPGFSSPDEIAQQVIYAQECEAYEGGIFNSLFRLIENPQTSTDLLIKLFKHEVNVDHVLTELAVTKPDQMEFSTFEPDVYKRQVSAIAGGMPPPWW